MILLLACTAETADSADASTSSDDVLDLRLTEADIPNVPEGAMLLWGPDTEIGPGEDKMICVYGTYTGPTVGMTKVTTYQPVGGHHLQLMGTSTPALDAADGEIVDCSGEGGVFNMADMEPLGIANEAWVGGEKTFELPLAEGMAIELEEGQRYVMQSHYINTNSQPIRIQDVATIEAVPESEVETWAAPVIFNTDQMTIPAGESATTSFECTTEKEWNVLFSLGHMHEWGTSFTLEQKDGDAWAPYYTVEDWDPVYRDAPVVQGYGEGEMVWPAGSTFRTTCNWFNDTDADLVFPHEMCVAVNMVYPQQSTVICDGT